MVSRRSERRTRRFHGYGVISDNIWNLVKSAGSKILPAVSSAIGNKIGNKVADRIRPVKTNVDRKKQIKEAMELVYESDPILESKSHVSPTRDQILSSINFEEYH